MICKTCNENFTHDSGIEYDQCDDCFLIENEHPLSKLPTWYSLEQSKQQDIFKYLKLLKRFTKNPNLINTKHKKWLLENCDLPTELVPNELMGEYWLD